MNTLTKICIGVILFLLLALGFQYCQNKKSVQAVLTESSGKDTVITRYKAADGSEHALAVARLMTITDLENTKDGTVDSLKKEVKNWKDLYVATNFNSRTAGKVTAPVTTIDTYYVDRPGDTIRQPVKDFSWHDKWLYLHGDIFTDSARVGYILNNEYEVNYVNMSQDTLWKPKTWFKPKELTVDIVSKNPNTTTVKTSNIVLVPNKKAFYQTNVFWLGVGALAAILIFK